MTIPTKPGLSLMVLLAGLLTSAVAQAGPPAAWRSTLNHPRPGLLRYWRQVEGMEPVDEAARRHARVSVATLWRPGRRTELYLVFASSDPGCGMGGCGVDVVISRDGGRSFHLLDRVVPGDVPLRVLPTSHHGLPDLGIGLHILDEPPEAVVTFDGRHYADNPTVPPARPITGLAQGRVVMPESAYGHGFAVYR